ncbi:MAG TPA: sigma-70 family RNA polymerase sigma factor [Polyangia bacterium]
MVSTKAPHTRGAIVEVAAPAAADPGGARAALPELLAAARPRMFAVALRMTRNPDDAEDVVQEAMLKVWRSFGRFEGRAALSTWIHRIVVNAALDRLRARGPAAALGSRAADDREAEGAYELPSAVVETPEDLVSTAEVSGEVHRLLQALPPVHRQALALRELEGESYQSIAEIARCPIGTVMSRLHHARHRLASEITANHAHLMPRAA